MSTIRTEFKATISSELTEGEAMALDAICGYGSDQFKKWFYKTRGEHYLRPFEKHLDSLFTKARSLQSAVKQFDKAREQLKEIKC